MHLLSEYANYTIEIDKSRIHSQHRSVTHKATIIRPKNFLHACIHSGSLEGLLALIGMYQHSTRQADQEEVQQGMIAESDGNMEAK